MRTCLLSAVLFAVALSAADSPAERFYSAIRNDKLGDLKALIAAEGPQVRDKRGTTALMTASAYGSLDAMKMLIAAGADVNAKNDFDATALMWCGAEPAKAKLLLDSGASVKAVSRAGRTPLLIIAAESGSSEVVKMLLARGADPNAADKAGFTPLMMAAQANDLESVKSLVAAGADVNPKPSGERPEAAAANGFYLAPLSWAAASGNVEMVRLLLAKGANVNARGMKDGGSVKNGPIQLGQYTALLVASVYGPYEVVKALLDAGADVNAQDVRGSTPLIYAVTSDRPDPKTVQLLLARGAKKDIRTATGETALDWARKFNRADVLGLLGAKQEPLAAARPVAAVKPAALRPAIGKSLGQLGKLAGTFFESGGCGACHAQNLATVAFAAAARNGFQLDEAGMKAGQRAAAGFWASFEQPSLQRLDPPVVEILSFQLLEFAWGGMEPSAVTDALVHNIAAQQSGDGSWHAAAGGPRPPMEDGDVARTALSLLALKKYGPPGRKDLSARIERAAAWLARTNVVNSDDRAMRLLGLVWAGAPNTKTAPLVREMVALQRADGGWAQTPDLASDAYGAGQTLWALHEAGMPATDPVYQKGVAFLLSTQKPDGTWHVASRAMKFQPYFQSGFPYDHDQWISSAATAYATAALCYATGAMVAKN